MHPEVQEKRGKRFGYYVTELSREGRRQRLKVVRTGADEVEALAVTALRAFLNDRPALSEALVALGNYDAQTTACLKAAPRLSMTLGKLDPPVVRSVLQTVIVRAELGRERLVLLLACAELPRLLEWDGMGMFKPGAQVPKRLSAWVYRLEAPAAIVREARQICLPIPQPDEARPGKADPRLIRLLEEAREAQALVYANRDRTLLELAREQGCGPAFFSRLVRLNYLAPDIVAMIVDGHQPPGLDRRTLLKQALPLDWTQQRLLFGFPPRRDEGGSFRRTARGHAPRTAGLI